MPERSNDTPTILVAFGVTGDLMRLKILPALYRLHARGEFPERFRLVGYSRRDWGAAEFREYVRGVLAERVPDATPASVDAFLAQLSFQGGEFSQPESYAALKRTLESLDAAWGACSNKVFYLSVAPTFYGQIANDLAGAGLTAECASGGGWTRLVIEKPFGQDGTSAAQLESLLAESFGEEQVYRIDHYLAKDTAREMLATGVEDAASITSVTIRLFETVGVERRGAFYDAVGALRDVGQNHMLEILALLTMNRPAELSAEGVRAARAEVLEALDPIAPEAVATETYRARYDGYLSIPGVAPDSITETYFKIRASLRSARWQSVPITLEAGKRLGEARKEVIIERRGAEPLRFDLDAHVPGEVRIDEYERLVKDVLRGDQTLFVSAREVAAAWRFIDPIMRAWQAGVESASLHTYAPDTAEMQWGSAE